MARLRAYPRNARFRVCGLNGSINVVQRTFFSVFRAPIEALPNHQKMTTKRRYLFPTEGITGHVMRLPVVLPVHHSSLLSSPQRWALKNNPISIPISWLTFSSLQQSAL